MMKYGKRIAAISLAAVFGLSAQQALAVDQRYISGAAAYGGAGFVAYHTVGKPTAGSLNYAATYQGVTWGFASAENKAVF